MRSSTPRLELRTCGTCRHFEVVEEGYEVAGLLDTAYLISRCRLMEWQVKEFYLLGGGADQVEPAECPFWEYWGATSKMPKEELP